jgi:hypothetical protein
MNNVFRLCSPHVFPIQINISQLQSDRDFVGRDLITAILGGGADSFPNPYIGKAYRNELGKAMADIYWKGMNTNCESAFDAYHGFLLHVRSQTSLLFEKANLIITLYK